MAIPLRMAGISAAVLLIVILTAIYEPGLAVFAVGGGLAAIALLREGPKKPQDGRT